LLNDHAHLRKGLWKLNNELCEDRNAFSTAREWSLPLLTATPTGLSIH